jgi:hypothetical protein
MSFFKQILKKDNNSNTPVDKSRRAVLKWMGLGSLSLGTALTSKSADISAILAEMAEGAEDVVRIGIIRPQDLLYLQLNYYNFTRQRGTNNLTRVDGGQALLVVYFQPQSMIEQAWFEASPGSSFNEPVRVPGKIFMADKSRLVYEIPAGVTTIPLATKDLLNWDNYSLVVNNRAKPFTKKGLPIYKIPGKLQLPGGKPDFQLQGLKKMEAAAGLLEQSGTPAARQLYANYFRRNAGRNEVVTVNDIRKSAQARGNVNIAVRPGVIGSVVRLAGGNLPGPVDEKETALELPFRLFVSPPAGTGWLHTYLLGDAPGLFKKTNKVFELWHTRLAVKTKYGLSMQDDEDASTAYKVIRALWAADASKQHIPLPAEDKTLLTAMTNVQRHKIVHESSNFSINNFTPKPAMVNNMMLTSLGAWLDAEMLVDSNDLKNAGLLDNLNVLKWRHIATMGRDHYVEILEAGNIFPFGHEAVLATVTERKIDAATGAAANKQRKFIIIAQTEKTYVQRDAENNAFMRFPCSVVRFITDITPPLDKPASYTGAGDAGQFKPQVNGKDFLFQVKLIDTEGNETNVSVPLVFVSTVGAQQALPAVVAAYNQDKKVKTADAGGQKMAIAPSLIPGDTTYETTAISFAAKTFQKDPAGFLPEITSLDIAEPSYRRISGKSTPLTVNLVDDNNSGHVFAEVTTPAEVKFNSSVEKTGGSVLPNFKMTGLSKLQGVFGGDRADMEKMSFDPQKYFGSSGALLFGVIKLGDLMQGIGSINVDDYTGPLNAKVQELSTLKVSLAAATESSAATIKSQIETVAQSIRELNAGYKNFRIPMLKTFEDDASITTQYIWKGAAKPSFTAEIVTVTCNDADNAISVVTNYVQRKDSSSKPLFNTASSINNFSVTLAGLIQVNFDKVGFAVDNNAKVDVNIQMKPKPIKFLGVLSFINDFEKLIPAQGFSDPPFLDVTTAGVKTGYNMSVPDLQLGAFTLSNISLGAYVNLPFNGDALTVGFNFCERNQPFTLTIAALGGGGFFGFELDFKGIRQIEAALEFGAAVAINLGVAKGRVSIMGGIYFKMVFKEGKNDIQLTGYVRMNGCLSIIGLIKASVEFYMGLTALMTGDKCTSVYGEVTVKIKVSVAFFSKTVSIHTSREFAGAGNDPNFQMMTSQQDWLAYCGAFAA